MLQQVLDYIHNYFVPKGVPLVTYTISGGVISPLSDVGDGDRILICGSRRNDGIYTWHASGIKDDDDQNAAGLRDETFAGTIRVMSVPPALVTLSEEISQWVDTFGSQLSSPFQSESFNGYSYTMKAGGKSGGNGPLTWRDQFGSQLEIWRKPSV